jgi:formylglycine-generating enzyme required for sulfatase activity
MATAAAVVELVGKQLLPLLGEGQGQLDVTRLAREIWNVWGKDARQADFDLLSSVELGNITEKVTEAVKRLLPERNPIVQAEMIRTLSTLPALANRLRGLHLEQFEDLLLWLPARVPWLWVGEKPRGVGDRELLVPIRVESTWECWTARNPHLPRAAPVMLVFYSNLEHAQSCLRWHKEIADPGVLALSHSYLDAEYPCLEFQSQAAIVSFDKKHWTRVVEIAARIHQRTPLLCLGSIHPSNVFIAENGSVHLLIAQPPATNNPREDVLHLGKLLLWWSGGTAEPKDAILTSCLALDPLQRPPDASAILDQLGNKKAEATTAASTLPKAASNKTGSRLASAAGRGVSSSDLLKVLDVLGTTAKEVPKTLTNSVGVRFRLIEPGIFMMGSPPSEAGRRDNEGPAHEVKISKGFYIGIYPITQAQYEAVLGKNPSRFTLTLGGGANHPVENVSWDDAVLFCERLSGSVEERKEGRTYRLPTEAEWEYACRSGTTTPFFFGSAMSSADGSLDGKNPYGDAPRGASATRTSAVGSYRANHFGLFDMHGNVWEWCQDYYGADYYVSSPRTDPQGPSEGEYRVLRGGSWRNQAVTCRSAYRNALPSNQKQPYIGFRVVVMLGE